MDAKAGVGDNHVDPKELESYISQIETVESEKRALGDDIKDIYKEAKEKGYDPKVMRMIVSRRRRDANIVKMEDEMMDAYLSALGMI